MLVRLAQKPIHHEIDPDRQKRDGAAGGKERRIKAVENTLLVVAHHAAPIREGRLHAEAEEERPATNRKVKQKRRPNSANSGAKALGRTSRADHPPEALAAQPRAFGIFHHRDALGQNPRQAVDAVESRSAMVTISTGSDEPSGLQDHEREFRTGTHMTVSTRRESTVSNQPPTSAARKPSGMPIEKDRSEAACDTPIDICAPARRRGEGSMSRPFWSSPSQ